MTLALYDVVIFCDDSGSMAFEEGGERVNDLKVILGRVAEVATLFDHNGINIRFPPPPPPACRRILLTKMPVHPRIPS